MKNEDSIQPNKVVVDEGLNIKKTSQHLNAFPFVLLAIVVLISSLAIEQGKAAVTFKKVKGDRTEVFDDAPCPSPSPSPSPGG